LSIVEFSKSLKYFDSIAQGLGTDLLESTTKYLLHIINLRLLNLILSQGLIKTDLAILFRETPLVPKESQPKVKGGETSTEVTVGRASAYCVRAMENIDEQDNSFL
jgi:hypothetical protein